MKRIAKLCAVLILTVLMPLAACAQQGIMLDAAFALDDTVMYARVNALCIGVHAGEAPFEGEVSVDVQQNSGAIDRISMPLSVKAGETAQVRIPVRVLTAQKSFPVTLSTQGEIVESFEYVPKNTIQAQKSVVIGVPGGGKQLIEALDSLPGADPLGRQETVFAAAADKAVLGSPEELSAFDILAADSAAYGALSDEARANVLRFLKDGGILVIGGCDALEPEWALCCSDMELEEHEGFSFSSCEEGLLVTCGESLSSPEMLERLSGDAALRRALIAYDAQRYTRMADEYHNLGNYSISQSILGAQHVSEGVSIAPVLAVLTVYILITGVGMFVVLKLRDRSKLLWAVIPVCAVLGVGVIMLAGAALDLNEPAASSVHAVFFGEDGYGWAEEGVDIAFPQQGRVLIAAQTGERVERRESGYYSEYYPEETHELRDVVTIGESPTLSMPGAAPWLVRGLSVRTERMPVRAPDTRAWMEKDGLHVQVKNTAGVTLGEVYLLSSLGYAYLGDIAPQAEAEALLLASEDLPRAKNGQPAILDGRMLPYARHLYEVEQACVDPELQEDAQFDESALSAEERARRGMLSYRLSISRSGVQDGFVCMLSASTPEIACAPLMLDGEPVTRHVWSSVLTARIAVDYESDGGYFYYPQGVFEAHTAREEDSGALCLGDVYTPDGRIQDGQTFGFDLSALNGKRITQLAVISDASNSMPMYRTLIYDHEKRCWTTLDSGAYAAVSGALLKRCIDAQGQVFVRYESSDPLAYGYFTPEIIVEGGEDS